MVRPSAERLALLRKVLAAEGVSAPADPAIPRRCERSSFPVSFAQERLYFLELYEPGTALHNDALAVRIEDPELDPELVRRALLGVIDRHEILRTSFFLGDDGPLQRVEPDVDLPFRFVDLRGTDAHARADELLGADARKPFALERAPLARASLCRLSDVHWVLGLTLHHIVSDGRTFGIVFREIGALYAARGADAALPELPIQFGDYAAWERETIDEARIAAQLPFWTRALDSRRALRWPARLSAGGGPSGRGALARFTLEGSIFVRLTDFCRRQELTTNWVLLAAFFALLHGISGEDQPCIGSACGLRRRPELADLAGFFVQTLVLRADLGGNPSFRELVARVRECALEAARHQDVPFDRIVRALGAGPAPLIQAWFTHMKDMLEPPVFSAGESTASEWPSVEFVDAGIARFEAALILDESSRGIAGVLEYDTNVLAQDGAESLLAGYVAILDAALARPRIELSELGALAVSRTGRRAPGARALPRHTQEGPSG